MSPIIPAFHKHTSNGQRVLPGKTRWVGRLRPALDISIPTGAEGQSPSTRCSQSYPCPSLATIPALGSDRYRITEQSAAPKELSARAPSSIPCTSHHSHSIKPNKDRLPLLLPSLVLTTGQRDRARRFYSRAQKIRVWDQRQLIEGSWLKEGGSFTDTSKPSPRA